MPWLLCLLSETLPAHHPLAGLGYTNTSKSVSFHRKQLVCQLILDYRVTSRLIPVEGCSTSHAGLGLPSHYVNQVYNKLEAKIYNHSLMWPFSRLLRNTQKCLHGVKFKVPRKKGDANVNTPSPCMRIRGSHKKEKYSATLFGDLKRPMRYYIILIQLGRIPLIYQHINISHHQAPRGITPLPFSAVQH